MAKSNFTGDRRTTIDYRCLCMLIGIISSMDHVPQTDYNGESSVVETASLRIYTRIRSGGILFLVGPD